MFTMNLKNSFRSNSFGLARVAGACLAFGLLCVATTVAHAGDFWLAGQNYGDWSDNWNQTSANERRLPVNTGSQLANDFSIPFQDGFEATSFSLPQSNLLDEAGQLIKFAKTAPATAEEIQARLTSRYGNPQLQRFVQSLTPDRGMALYQEATNLIDSRHFEPATHLERIHRAAVNLMQAVQNTEFVKASGMRPSASNLAAFQQTMLQLANAGNIRNADDAMNALQWTMYYAGNQVGLSPGVVATEFVFAATETLDKYSTLIPPTKDNGPKAALEDHVVGIGVSIELGDDGLQVVRVLPGGSAADAGLKKGDVIVSINGQSMKGKNLDQAVDLITGREGTALQLQVRRDNRNSQMTLVRRYIEISSISDVQMLDQEAGVGYFKLEHFSQTSSADMDKALWKLHGEGMRSLILDLRGNPGGLLTSAIEISNKFVPEGEIVSTRGRNASDNTREFATYEQTWKVPLVLIVDGNSASASEIFAAAVQENGRGLLVGQNSYGKGTVQTQFPLNSVSASLKLTTAKFYSPIGREMAGAGVKPDILVEESQSKGNGDDAELKTALDVAKGNRLRDLAETKSRPTANRLPALQS